MTFIELDGFCFGYYWHNGQLLTAITDDLISCIVRLGTLSLYHANAR